jgi:hypothetical protein
MKIAIGDIIVKLGNAHILNFERRVYCKTGARLYLILQWDI